MKRVKLAYGKTGLDIQVPDEAVVIEPRHLDGLPEEREAFLAAVGNPIGAPPLRESAKRSDRVAIVISDITRPTPNHKLVPWLLAELEHVPRENFVIINGVGSHRANTREELIALLGKDIVETIRIENHNSFAPEQLVHVGRNSHGSEVYFNKTYVESDFKIVTGFIEPHFFAGFSGGPKGIQPGISGIRTILDFHNARMISHPNTRWGVTEGNMVQDSATQSCLLSKPDFMVNVTLNGKKEITQVFAGDVIKAHRKGCEFVKQHAMCAVDGTFDVVITSNAGYPLDQNLYQTVKGMSAAAQIVAQGGSIIAVSECSDGVPNHGNYAKILQMRETPRELVEMICDPAFSMFDQWQVLAQALVQLKAECHLFSGLAEATVRQAKLIPVASVEKTLAQLIGKHGPRSRVAVMPLGPLVIPYVKAE
jgi:nickel-dependent lactate racemase